MSNCRERLELGFHKLMNAKNCLNPLEYKRGGAWGSFFLEPPELNPLTL